MKKFRRIRADGLAKRNGNHDGERLEGRPPGECVVDPARRTSVRIVLLSSIVALAAACGSSTTGGAVSLSFGDAGATSGGVFTTTPAGAAMIQGTFSATGNFEGQYTLATSVPSGSPIASCLVSVDGGTSSTSVQINASSSQAHTLTVEIGVGPDYRNPSASGVLTWFTESAEQCC
jgi:hypothetical protein